MSILNWFSRRATPQPQEKLFYLDFHTMTLLGYERSKSEIVIAANCLGIEHEDRFPPVPVCKVDERTYALTTYCRPGRIRKEGGHNRAVAHYIMDRPLLCKLVDQRFLPVRPTFPIQNIVVREDAGDAYLRAGDEYEFPGYRWPQEFLDDLKRRAP